MTVAVAIKERPFDGRLRTRRLVGPMPTIAEIIDREQDLPRAFAALCDARVNGELVPRELWPRVRPKLSSQGDVVVTFTLPLQGGGGGGQGRSKNPATQIATIAVLLVAAAVSGGAASPLLGAGFAAGTVGASVAGAAIGIGGSLAIAALVPPPTLAGNQAQSGPQIEGAQGTQAASLSDNVLSKGNPVPRVIGTHRVFPPILTPPLVDIDGDIEVAEAVYGLAGGHALSDIFVGQTPATSIIELETEIQDGLPNSQVLTLVTRQGFTDTTGAVELTAHDVEGGDGISLKNQVTPTDSCPQWEGLASRLDPDEIWIAIQMPAGLSRTAGEDMAVPLRLRIRKQGDTAWINLPEVHYARNLAQPVTFMVKLKFTSAPSARSTPVSLGGFSRAFTSVPAQAVTPSGLGGWTSDSYFYAGSGDTYFYSSNLGSTGVINTEIFADRAEFYLNDGTKFPSGYIWEIQIMRAQAYAHGNLTPSTYNYSNASGIADLFQYIGTHFTTVLDQRTVSDKMAVLRVASVWNEHPVPDPTKFAVIAARVRGRSVSQLSVLASGYVKDWDGSAWGNLTTTSNPAPHFYDILTGTIGGSPIPTDIVDSSAIVAWRTHCNTMGYTVNAVVEGKTYADVLKMVAAAGYARPTHNEKWSVFIDKDRSAETPIQIFTPRNMKNFAWTKAFAKLPTGVRAAYNNADKNYLADEIIVYADKDNPDSSKLEQIQYDGLVYEADVTARAQFDQLQASARFTFYRGECDLEAIVCQRGDLVGVQHDILATQTGFARIKSIATSGGNVTGLTLDGTVPVNSLDGIFDTASLFSVDSIFDLGAGTGLAIRLKGGNGLLVKEVTAAENGDVTDLQFVTPFADPGTDELDIDCLCAIGRLGSEYRRLLVFGIVPNADLGASMTFVDEAPELFQ